MRGSNPKRPPERGDGTTLQVEEIFPTFQGEGPFAGQSAVFIRLGGCNLACDFCDTQFESFHPMSLSIILRHVEHYSKSMSRPLVVITGGEPLRQPIERLCSELLARDYMVQVETNGTLWRELDARVHVICSPKAVAGIYGRLRPDVLERAAALKFVISANKRPYDRVPNVGQGDDMPIYLQPMEEGDPKQDARNLSHAVDLSRRYGCFLSVQLHKVMGVA